MMLLLPGPCCRRCHLVHARCPLPLDESGRPLLDIARAEFRGRVTPRWRPRRRRDHAVAAAQAQHLHALGQLDQELRVALEMMHGGRIAAGEGAHLLHALPVGDGHEFGLVARDPRGRSGRPGPCRAAARCRPRNCRPRRRRRGRGRVRPRQIRAIGGLPGRVMRSSRGSRYAGPDAASPASSALHTTPGRSAGSGTGMSAAHRADCRLSLGNRAWAASTVPCRFVRTGGAAMRRVPGCFGGRRHVGGGHGDRARTSRRP